MFLKINRDRDLDSRVPKGLVIRLLESNKSIWLTVIASTIKPIHENGVTRTLVTLSVE